MRYSKGWLFTFPLLLLIIAEFCVFAYDLLNPDRDEFSFDKHKVDIVYRKVAVDPFTFEIPFHEYMDKIIDDVGKEVSSDLISDIYTTEKIIHPEKFANAEEDIEQGLVFGEFEYGNQTEEEVTVADEEDTLPVDENNKAKIVIVIDDMGISKVRTDEIMSLGGALTTSFLTYGNAKKETAEKALEKGFEVMLHVPMMPHVQASLAPVTLSSEMSDEELQEKFGEMLARYDGVKMLGINNHMGSKFTEDEHALSVIIKMLKDRNMYFLDSKTTPKSVGKKVTEEYGVPYIARDVFLDNENNYDYVMKQLLTAEQIALKKGYAIAIGHPREATVKALKAWIEHLDKEKFELIHMSELLKILNKV